MKHSVPMLFIFVLLLLFVGCSSKALLDVSAATESTQEETFNKIKGAMVNNGFDIKDENGEAGYITTTYKKWSFTKQEGGNPGSQIEKRITLRLQMRAKIGKSPDGKIQITLSPGVKQHIKEIDEPSLLGAVVEVAKIALAKPSEEVDLGDDDMLKFYEPKDREIGFFTSDEEKIRIGMLNAFLKTSDEIAAVCGISKEQMKFNIGN